MSSDKSRDLHAQAELERAMYANVRRWEQREQTANADLAKEHDRWTAAVHHDWRADDTGFSDGWI